MLNLLLCDHARGHCDALEPFAGKIFLLLFVPLEIPQFGFLSCVSSLRLSSGHSGPVLTLRTDDAAHASLPSPHSLVADARTWATSLLGVVVRHVICGFYLFVCLFSLLVMLPSEIPKLPHRPTSVRVSWCLETSPLSRLPPWDGSLSLTLLSLFLSFIFCPSSF